MGRPVADLPGMNAAEIAIFEQIAHSEADGPVLMLNLNKYRDEAQYPEVSCTGITWQCSTHCSPKLAQEFFGGRLFLAMSSGTKTLMKPSAFGIQGIRHF